MLLLGLTFMVPASAQQAGAIALAPSATFAPGGKIVQDLVRKRDFIGARNALSGLTTKAVTAADRYLLGNFNLEIGLFFNDAAMQRKGLVTMLGSGLAPAADAPRLHYYAGQLALNAKDFADARMHLLAAAAGNQGGASTQVYLAEAYFGQAHAHQEGEGYDAAGKALVRQGLPHLRKAIAIEQASGKPVDPKWVLRGVDLAVMAEDPDADAWRALAGQIAPKTASGM
jgi:hypothetical protein